MKYINCFENAGVDFVSKFSYQKKQIFQLLLHLMEVQDIVTQFAHLRNHALIGFNNLPQSVISILSNHFKKIPGMPLTTKTLILLISSLILSHSISIPRIKRF